MVNFFKKKEILNSQKSNISAKSTPEHMYFFKDPFLIVKNKC